MRYVFSTGPEIDSMVMSGYTADSYNADSVSKSFIWFFPVSYTHLDVYKRQPLGYIFAIGLMIFCSALTIWYFKYKKWL